jgi:hypothetical protein
MRDKGWKGIKDKGDIMDNVQLGQFISLLNSVKSMISGCESFNCHVKIGNDPNQLNNIKIIIELYPLMRK